MSRGNHLTRRQFIRASSTLFGAGVLSKLPGSASGFETPNERPAIGVVGCGCRWDKNATVIGGPYGQGKQFPKFGDILAVCDVDSDRVGRAQGLVNGWLGKTPDGVADYRKVLERDDIDIVHIVTPDHWHAKVAIEAMLAGKDVYCEKPMTLTIEEGQRICEVCRKTGRICQVGTQQRSAKQMIQAIAMIRAGRLGTLKKVVCGIGGAPTSPELPVAAPPKHLDWNSWLGPAPVSKYHFLAGADNIMKNWSRCHYEFRWWYEYSGGKLTDWGAHHVDIATWGMDKTATGPVSVDPVMVEHPIPFKDGYPTIDNKYNTATRFHIKATYADGVELSIHHDKDNGILFEGTEGRIFVNRGRLTGKPVEELKSNPLPDGALEEVYKNRPLTDHVSNFFKAVQERQEPISDVFSHHRALSTCHLAGIAARLGRKIRWDPKAQRVIDDPRAQALVGREKRKGFEIEI